MRPNHSRRSRSAAAHWYRPAAQSKQLRREDRLLMTEDRFHRQELLFGREGQKRVESRGVAIVGAGGLGSHVAQQLAYLGTRHFLLVDADRVRVSNLNRLVGATQDDADA